MKLHPATIDALRHKAGVAHDTWDESDPDTNWCLAVDRECRAVAAAGTVAALRASEEAKGEMENYLGGDLSPGEATAIVADLCRVGWYERYTPGSVALGRRPKTRTVDGVRFVTGY